MKISLFINLIYIFKMSKVRCFWERKHVRDYCNTVYYFTFGMYPKFITCLILFCLFWAMALLPWLLLYCSMARYCSDTILFIIIFFSINFSECFVYFPFCRCIILALLTLMTWISLLEEGNIRACWGIVTASWHRCIHLPGLNCWIFEIFEHNFQFYLSHKPCDATAVFAHWTVQLDAGYIVLVTNRIHTAYGLIILCTALSLITVDKILKSQLAFLLYWL